jgi:predicted MPP superfamily phosphohydrolase
MGLVDFGGIQQFVSGGLGSSNIPFRLFNTPEINLLILKAKQ